MICPSCSAETKVLESRRAENGAAVRRRRECMRCGHRFTSFERREPGPLFVRKRSGGRERFDPTKLRASLLRAAHKRPVAAADVEEIVARIAREAEKSGGELPSERIGEMCLEGLRDLDLGAYLQFAAVYRELADLESVRDELERLRADPGSRALTPSGAS